ncbi:hypothetical protein SERLA73DRAFT_149083 [Serpula lacrymans var. lacrymans S7.3]|uniref:Uncharacterized protein n=1 Tax=Serpula lacrymans var. lacrymans (strain S7.3) TaxID=936435 RepID=F8PEZ3_SERL3|nr:hypothetical protein SERLA73DRAFT_149083 [Serpula lacrymans var. lacrymans S7.3]
MVLRPDEADWSGFSNKKFGASRLGRDCLWWNDFEVFPLPQIYYTWIDRGPGMMPQSSKSANAARTGGSSTCKEICPRKVWKPQTSARILSHDSDGVFRNPNQKLTVPNLLTMGAGAQEVVHDAIQQRFKLILQIKRLIFLALTTVPQDSMQTKVRKCEKAPWTKGNLVNFNSAGTSNIVLLIFTCKVVRVVSHKDTLVPSQSRAGSADHFLGTAFQAANSTEDLMYSAHGSPNPTPPPPSACEPSDVHLQPTPTESLRSQSSKPRLSKHAVAADSHYQLDPILRTTFASATLKPTISPSRKQIFSPVILKAPSSAQHSIFRRRKYPLLQYLLHCCQLLAHQYAQNNLPATSRKRPLLKDTITHSPLFAPPYFSPLNVLWNIAKIKCYRQSPSNHPPRSLLSLNFLLSIPAGCRDDTPASGLGAPPCEPDTNPYESTAQSKPTSHANEADHDKEMKMGEEIDTEEIDTEEDMDANKEIQKEEADMEKDMDTDDENDGSNQEAEDDQFQRGPPREINLARESTPTCSDMQELFKLIQGIKQSVKGCKEALVGVDCTMHKDPSGLDVLRSKLNHKLTRHPVHRPDLSKRIACPVASHIDRLLGTSKLASMVTTVELKLFATTWKASVEKGLNCPPCCTVDHFCIDTVSGPRSPWNKSAARVFADDCVSFHGIDKTYVALQTVMRQFHTHVKGLKAKWARLSKSSQEKKLHVLGPDGMSSDKSDDEFNGHNYFKIVEPQFRASVVTSWLRAFDAIHAINRKIAQDKRGAWARLRVAQLKYSSSNMFVPGFPINAYCHKWLSVQSDTNRRFIIHPLEEEYDFSHDPQILQLLTSNITDMS